MLLLMRCKAFFHINLKLYIWEIPAQQQSVLCFSVWPSAITRMCNYNLAQVKFNQSPQAQRNLRLPGKRRRRGRRGRGRRGSGERGRRRKERKGRYGSRFPTQGTGSWTSFSDKSIGGWRVRVRRAPDPEGRQLSSGVRVKQKRPSRLAWSLHKI